MLRAAIKFCGGCNPRYDRGAAYAAIVDATREVATFSLPQADTHYDLLLIIRGCTGCPYLYEEDIDADRRIVCSDAREIDDTIRQILAMHTKEED